MAIGFLFAIFFVLKISILEVYMANNMTVTELVQQAEWYAEHASFDSIVGPAIRYNKTIECEAKLLFIELTSTMNATRTCIIKDSYFEEIGLNTNRIPGLVEQLADYNFIESQVLYNSEQTGIIRHYHIIKGV